MTQDDLKTTRSKVHHMRYTVPLGLNFHSVSLYGQPVLIYIFTCYFELNAQNDPIMTLNT